MLFLHLAQEWMDPRDNLVGIKCGVVPGKDFEAERADVQGNDSKRW